MEHEATEGGPEVKGQCLVHHAQEDELHIQLLGDLVYGQILTVQTHPGKELQLIPGEVQSVFTLMIYGRYLTDQWRLVLFCEIARTLQDFD